MGYTEGQETNDIPFGIPLVLGRYTELSGIQKFGFNPAVSTAEETIWSAGGDIDYIATAGTASVTSSNTGADNGGTVKIDGLDANYNLQSETITIGQTGSLNFIRMFRATLITANTGTTNSGNITVTVDSKTAAHIPAGYGQSLQCNYTVPANYRAFILQVDGGTDEKEKPIHFVVKTRDTTVTDAAFQTKAYMVFENTRTVQSYDIPIMLQEKTDIELRAKSPDGELEVSGGFELVLEKK